MMVLNVSTGDQAGVSLSVLVKTSDVSAELSSSSLSVELLSESSSLFRGSAKLYHGGGCSLLKYIRSSHLLVS